MLPRMRRWPPVMLRLLSIFIRWPTPPRSATSFAVHRIVVVALEARAVEPLTRAAAAAAILEWSTPAVAEVLCRYPSAATRDRATAEVLWFLDVQVRKLVSR